MNAPFSEGEIIRQSQQGNPVRVHTPCRGPRHPLRFFICPVEGTSIQWQSLTQALDEKPRRDIWAHLGKGLSFALSAKCLYYLPALESWGEGSLGCFGNAKTTLGLQ